MKNEYLNFAKNMGIAVATGLAVGAGVAEVANMVSDNQTLNAIVSTVGEYVAAYSVFLPLHARDNREIYTRENGTFDWKSFVGDQIKLAGGLLALDIAYLTGRPYVAKAFLESGMEPAKASLTADFILYPLLFIATIPIAKLTRIIGKAKGGLEEKVMDSQRK